MLTRNTLLVSESVLQRCTQILSNGKPWCHLIEQASAIAVNAARRIVRQLIESAEAGLHSVLPTLINPLHAAYILILQVINHPKSRMMTSDLAVSLSHFIPVSTFHLQSPIRSGPFSGNCCLSRAVLSQFSL